ncbi:MAG: hypothetical protein M3R03_01945 [Pseudomonadota bacterium]|nr:hypothetical protein [Pseudomonadota bacterium]
MKNDYSEARVKAPAVIILPLCLALLACTDATTDDRNPSEKAFPIVDLNFQEPPKPAALASEPPQNIPSDAEGPQRENVDTEVEAAPAEDPYAG